MKKNKLPSLITILIFTLIVVVVWISLSIYWSLSKKPAPSVPEEVSKPLTPTLDTNSLGKIQSRLFLNDSQIPEVTIAKSPTPAPIPEATAATIVSPAPIPSPTPATGSGTIP